MNHLVPMDNFTLVINSHRMCSKKKDVLKNFAIFIEKQMCWSLFLIKLQAFRPKKETPKQVFPIEHCEFLKNTYLEEHQRTPASDGHLYQLQFQIFVLMYDIKLKLSNSIAYTAKSILGSLYVFIS